MVNGFGFSCCKRGGEERTILPFLSNRLATGSELLFAVCDPTNGRDRRLVEEDFSNLDNWVPHLNAPDGGAIASGGTIQFTVRANFNNISLPRVLAINGSVQTLVLKITAASDIDNYFPPSGVRTPSRGGQVVLSTEDVGPESRGDNHEAFPTEANPWVEGSLIEIRLVAGTPSQFEYYLDGNLVSSSSLNSSDAFGCVFTSVRLHGDNTTAFSDLSLEVFGP